MSTLMSLYAIGDIHGHAATLDRLLARLPLTPDDTLIFVGDYVDRGPDSRAVVERVMELKRERGDRCICLLGNHEDMMLDHWRRTRGPWFDSPVLQEMYRPVSDYGAGFWLAVGGEATVRSYRGDIPEEHIRFLATLPLVYRVPGNSFVHAGLRPRGETARMEMLWGAPGFWGDIDPLTGDLVKMPPGVRPPAETVVVGHAAFEEPLVGYGCIGIDTGCAFGGPLTAVRLPEMEFYQEYQL